jgi:hypothetical protein
MKNRPGGRLGRVVVGLNPGRPLDVMRAPP